MFKMIKNKERKFGLGVFVCIFNQDFSKILLIKRNEEKRKKWKAEWGNVGGKIEFREMSIDACLREAKEEIGVDLNPDNLKLVKMVETPDSPIYNEYHVIHFAYATTINENTEINVNHESDGYRWFDLDHLPEKMLDSKEDILEIADKAKKMFEEK